MVTLIFFYICNITCLNTQNLREFALAKASSFAPPFNKMIAKGSSFGHLETKWRERIGDALGNTLLQPTFLFTGICVPNQISAS